jgi:hypothetical protein
MRFNRGAIVGCEDLANVFKQDAFGSRPCAGGRKLDYGRDPRLPCAGTAAAGCASLSARRRSRCAPVAYENSPRKRYFNRW